jgi:proteasome assembly chaperone (PAC2) family protein
VKRIAFFSLIIAIIFSSRFSYSMNTEAEEAKNKLYNKEEKDNPQVVILVGTPIVFYNDGRYFVVNPSGDDQKAKL